MFCILGNKFAYFLMQIKLRDVWTLNVIERSHKALLRASPSIQGHMHDYKSAGQ